MINAQRKWADEDTFFVGRSSPGHSNQPHAATALLALALMHEDLCWWQMNACLLQQL